MKRQFFNENDINLCDFADLCSQKVSKTNYPFCSNIKKKVVIYNGEQIRSIINSSKSFELKSELHHCLKEGPGVLIIQQAFLQKKTIDKATEIFLGIIKKEKGNAIHHGDHFARPGQNERLWNSLQKLCEIDPKTFISYYENPILLFLSEAWLGPFFQITSQVNIVKPGANAQEPHRDYHLGFQENSLVSKFPISSQILSQFLTLQGAIAHTDMGISSGPTIILPFSQQYTLGYMAWRNSKFKDYFKKNAIQIPMKKGDAMFLNPALFHAAGKNSESKDRIANLIQVSSAFGKALESVDRTKITKLIYPILLEKKKRNLLGCKESQTIGASVADGYPFPTNLDLNPPSKDYTPLNMQLLLEKALSENWAVEKFNLTIERAEKQRIP